MSIIAVSPFLTFPSFFNSTCCPCCKFVKTIGVMIDGAFSFTNARSLLIMVGLVSPCRLQALQNLHHLILQYQYRSGLKFLFRLQIECQSHVCREYIDNLTVHWRNYCSFSWFNANPSPIIFPENTWSGTSVIGKIFPSIGDTIVSFSSTF